MFDVRQTIADLRSRLSAEDSGDITRAALLVIGTIGLLFPMVFVLILAQGEQSVEYSRDLDRSFGRRVLVQNLSQTLHDARAYQYAYLLTEDPGFLRAYQVSYEAVPVHLDAILVEGTALPDATGRLRNLVHDRLAEMNLAMVVFQLAGSERALRVARGETAKSNIQELRTLFENIQSAEIQASRGLSERVQQQARAWEKTTLILLTGMAVAIIVAAVAEASDLLRRRKTEMELKAAQRLAQEAQEAAERASAAKSDFLATMSHEIRTPLNGVIGYTELLNESGGLSLEQREYVDRIQGAGYALLALVNDVLDFSRIEVGKVQLVVEPFSLPKLIDNAVSIVRSQARKKELPIRIDMDPRVAEIVQGDAAKLHQVLLNLLNNAVKFTDSGSVTLLIEHAGASEKGDWTLFSVIDTGPGISAEQQKWLFKRFSQLDHGMGRRLGGAGLGLAISKRVVELMGGEISVESVEGEGSTFWFKVLLPRAEMPLLQAGASDPARERMRRGRVLVVDDLDRNRELARAVLHMAGHEVDTVSDGNEAVAAVQRKTYDLVLLDVQMAGKDGVTAAREIRSLKHPSRDVPIIAMTANVIPHDIKRFLAAGMNDHLGKPYTRAQLLAKVQACLEANAGRAEKTEHAGQGGAGVPKEVEDGSDSIENLCRFMGRDWVVLGLNELKGHLEETFLKPDPGSVDRGELAPKAHVMVSRSSIFGFSGFANLCSRLEEACKTGQPLSPLLDEVQEAAAAVHGKTLEMLGRLEKQEV